MNAGLKVHQADAKNALASVEAKRSFDAEVTNIYDDMVVLTLYENGMIRDCNKAGARLLGCHPSDLSWQHISRLLPQLQGTTLLQGRQLNPHLRFLSRVGHHFEVVSLNSVRFVGKIFFSEVGNFLRVIIRPVVQEGAFS